MDLKKILENKVKIYVDDCITFDEGDKKEILKAKKDIAFDFKMGALSLVGDIYTYLDDSNDTKELKAILNKFLIAVRNDLK